MKCICSIKQLSHNRSNMTCIYTTLSSACGVPESCMRSDDGFQTMRSVGGGRGSSVRENRVSQEPS
jgi:hypothetical protein